MSKPWRRRLRTVGIAALAAVLLVAVVVVGLRWWQDRNRTELARAVGYAPADAQRLSWTDWSAVRSELDASLSADSTPEDVEEFLAEGYDADLTSTSAMVESASVLQDAFGFSPADVSWELLAQGETGSVLVLGLPDSLATDDLGDGFEELGYLRPSADDGVWNGGEELVARLADSRGGTLSPQFQYLALDADRHLLLASDSGPFLRDAARGLDDGLDDEGVRDVVGDIGSPLSAAVYTGDFVCRGLAMAQADADAQGDADQLLAAAGGVDPLTGFAMAAEPDGTLRIAMAFETGDQARRNADSRAALAGGPAPGQGGDFTDRFELGEVSAEGRVVTMALDPVDGSPVLSDLSTGPVLFATC